eukprot:11722082-Ditylum_brightwellii.AAC.1
MQQNNADNKHLNEINVIIKAVEADAEQLKDVGKAIHINAHHHNKLLPTSLKPTVLTYRILLTMRRLNLSIIPINNLT